MSFCLCFGKGWRHRLLGLVSVPYKSSQDLFPRAVFTPSEDETLRTHCHSKAIDRSFRLQMLSAPFITKRSSKKEQIVFIFKKQKPQLPSCTEWGHLGGFWQGKPAGWHSLLLHHPPERLCLQAMLTLNPHEAAAHQTAVTSPGWEERPWCIC